MEHSLIAAEGPASRTTPDRGGAKLSPREREVRQLMLAVRSNLDIAAALFISHRTATTHVSTVLPTLGVASGSEAAHAVRGGPVEARTAGAPT